MAEYQLTRSETAFTRAKECFPGGVNSPVRALGSVGGTPFFTVRGHGAEIHDADGHSYVDMVLAYGPLILGHGHPRVAEALHEAVEDGWSYGTPTLLETNLANRVRNFFPSMEKMRFVNSGTEATMSAIRLARGATGRDLTVKFEGCYHGHVDSLLVKAGSGALTHGHPDSGGVPTSIAETTLLAPFNDLEAVQALFERHGAQIASVILEPVAGNMGVIPPLPGFLEGLRALCDEHQSILIFDEVMTGFRVHRGGAQALYGVVPDLTCLGKVIGGGLPVGAFGGRADIMNHLAPEGSVYQAGTLSGNPLSMVAGCATLEVLEDTPIFDRLEERAAVLAQGLQTVADEDGIEMCVQQVGTMLTPFFQAGPVHRLGDVSASNFERFALFFHGMRREGVSIPPSQYEAWFLATTHDSTICDRVVSAARAVMAADIIPGT
ncbi:MAG: glutamate-1-semialdehyde-2,1-aminomutase [Myxococcales bacterium]|nr:glutamate-1-semialdehyde-2,1-aminomutase [Myxococcales bacterium]